MSSDLTDQLARIIEWISGLGFALPFAIFLIVQLLTRGKSEEKRTDEQATRPADVPDQPQRAPLPDMPFGLPTWLGMDQPAPSPSPQPAPPAQSSQWGHSFDRQVPNDTWSGAGTWGHGYDRPSAEEDDVLRWGSAFETDAEGEPIRWSSAFDEPGWENVYGWEPTRWGGTFPPRDSEPVIHVG